MKKGDKVRLLHTQRTVAYTIPKGTEGEVHTVLEDDSYLVYLPSKIDGEENGMIVVLGRDLEGI